LKVVHGEALYEAEVGTGFAMYIVENEALESLGGLQNMSSIEGNYTKGAYSIRINPMLKQLINSASSVLLRG
jgi:hypothetical protein